ncbi:hypothetical protein AVEN_111840-1 [Araneus ventricosus]|uniref:Uncharacterized protein n=1 Tax=Araneus ventricosus TaxID=182803 RepID=A0A4Y2BY36_ARAVE|nr:hypothetical protein AVEN_111840-1 [Araneus ventricosus]
MSTAKLFQTRNQLLLQVNARPFRSISDHILYQVLHCIKLFNCILEFSIRSQQPKSRKLCIVDDYGQMKHAFAHIPLMHFSGSTRVPRAYHLTPLPNISSSRGFQFDVLGVNFGDWRFTFAANQHSYKDCKLSLQSG